MRAMGGSMEQDIRFCTTSDGVSIAYATVGDGPALVVPPGWVTHLEQQWENPQSRALTERLAQRHTVVRYDKRGTGLSDRQSTAFTTDGLLPDLEAVIDALGVERASFLGISLGGALAIRYAATHPERAARLVLYGTTAHGEAITRDEVKQSMLAMVRAHWGMGSKALADLFVPDVADDPDVIERMAKHQRESSTAEVAAGLMEWQYTLDERELLPGLDVPTLVIHRRGERAIPSRLGRELASMIPGARLILLEGRNHAPVNAEEIEELVGPIDEFLAEGEEPEQAQAVASPTGAPVTILFTDIEGSTALTQRLGDAGAQELLHTHNASVREALAEHGGSEVKHTGDGIMASFPSASGAVECACAIQRALVDGKVRVRIGLNAGEPIAEDDDLFGTAVQLASRICDRAEPGQIFTSDVVRQLVAGKGFEFADAGAATLKGFEQPVALHEVRWQAG